MTALFPTPLMIDDPGSTAILRHDLITPVNHIIGFAELLIDDAQAKGRVFRGHSLVTIQAFAREATRAIDRSLAFDDPNQAPDRTALGHALMVPALAIVEACAALDEASSQAPDRSAFLEDLNRMRAAAVRLVKLARDFTGGR